MIIRSKAPFRLEFSGGGTDVPPFTDDQGGLIFNATIDHYAYCSIKSRPDNEFKVHSLDYNIIARFKDKNDLQFDGNLDLINFNN
jgi:D-glycero-alpha-D-manno-heptose-7-phosphate kinase